MLHYKVHAIKSFEKMYLHFYIREKENIQIKGKGFNTVTTESNTEKHTLGSISNTFPSNMQPICKKGRIKSSGQESLPFCQCPKRNKALGFSSVYKKKLIMKYFCEQENDHC